jgi:hypothetical protein
MIAPALRIARTPPEAPGLVTDVATSDTIRELFFKERVGCGVRSAECEKYQTSRTLSVSVVKYLFRFLEHTGDVACRPA